MQGIAQCDLLEHSARIANSLLTGGPARNMIAGPVPKLTHTISKLIAPPDLVWEHNVVCPLSRFFVDC